jgi:hypothetical protein
MVSELLETGEAQLGRYRIQFARMSRQGWIGEGPWMQGVLTNQRFLMIPESTLTGRGKIHPPTIINLNDVTKIWLACLGQHSGIVLSLKSGHHLHLFADWTEGRKMMRDVQANLPSGKTRPGSRHLQ